MFLCSLTLSNTSSCLIWSVQLIFSILLQHHISKLTSISDLLPEASKFQHHIKLCSKCSTSLASSSINIRYFYKNKERKMAVRTKIFTSVIKCICINCTSSLVSFE
jgi:hypothetical protein